MKRYLVIFTGLVQGVGFRWSLQQVAKKYGITGWVRNCYNGNVEAEMQGSEADIKKAISQINDVNRWISIDDYYMKEIDVVEKENGFIAKY